MCGSGWVVNIFCRSIMVVCMPRVFNVRTFRRWWVYNSLLGGGVVCVWELGLFSFGFIFSCEWGGFVLSTWVGLGRVGVVLVCVGPDVSFIVLVLRVSVVGREFHALHWNMLS